MGFIGARPLGLVTPHGGTADTRVPTPTPIRQDGRAGLACGEPRGLRWPGLRTLARGPTRGRAVDVVRRNPRLDCRRLMGERAAREPARRLMRRSGRSQGYCLRAAIVTVSVALLVQASP